MESLTHFFRPEERRRGEDLFGKGLVVISSASDCDVRGFIKGSSACRVSLSADHVSSRAIRGDCSCTTARKGVLCKHIWSVLLKLEHNDFVATKTVIEKVSVATPARATATERQSTYKKQNYERQKSRAKEMRQQKKFAECKHAPTYPQAVEQARAFFKCNGFALENMDFSELANAKKILLRVFHPDKGGSHDEVIILNRNFDVLRGYIEDGV